MSVQSSEKGIQTGYIFGSTFGVKKVKYEVIDGYAIFEGDIILGTAKQMNEISKSLEKNYGPHPEKAVVLSNVRDYSNRWPSGNLHLNIQFVNVSSPASALPKILQLDSSAADVDAVSLGLNSSSA